MESVILVIHLMLALAIIVIVLLQPSESGDGLTGGGGGVNAGIAAPRRSGNALTKATAILATGFFITSLGLSILAGHSPAKKSILDHVTEDGVTATEAATTAVEEAVEKAEDVKKDAKETAPKPPVAK